MAIDYTTTALIDSVKRRIAIPTSQALYTNLDFCKLATDELQSVLVPMMLAEQEDYFLHFDDQSIDGTTTDFNLPDRAIGRKIRDAGFYKSGSNEFVQRPRLEVEDYGDRAGNLVSSLSGYFFQGDQIIFNPAPTNVNDQLRIYYYRRPNNLVRETDCGKITNINTSTKVVTLNNASTGWTTSTKFDCIKGSGGFRSIQDSFTVTNIAGFDLTFSSLPTGIAVGDWVCPEGQSPIAQIPYEGHHLLAQLTAIKVLEGLGDAKGMGMAQEKYEFLLKNFIKTLTDRVDGSPKKVVNRSGIFRSRRRVFW
tara:strand:+ start:2087 stop:3010 length:924 start_codon:yes stop_codon:yes gene_type:complete